jgi:Glycosyl transferase family 2
VDSDVVWWPEAPEASRERVAVVSVSYNTRELTALLLWSLRRIVAWPALEIVTVDNGSRDGSAELLAEAAQARVCVLLANDGNRQHGPGLNHGISRLASRPEPLPGWIWILDSDVVTAHPDVLLAALAAADTEKAVRCQAAFRVWSGLPPAAMSGSHRWPVVRTASGDTAAQPRAWRALGRWRACCARGRSGARTGQRRRDWTSACPRPHARPPGAALGVPARSGGCGRRSGRSSSPAAPARRARCAPRGECDEFIRLGGCHRLRDDACLVSTPWGRLNWRAGPDSADHRVGQAPVRGGVGVRNDE